MKCVLVLDNPYYTLKYIVAIANLLFHIKLYCCNRLNLYFTSNFVDVIEVSNWVAGKLGKLTLFFFSLISSLSSMSIPFFFFSSQYFSFTHACLLFFFSHLNFLCFLTTSIFLFFSHLKFNSHPCLSLFFFLFFFFFLILVSLFISLTSISYFFAFFKFKKKNLKFSLSLSHPHLYTCVFWHMYWNEVFQIFHILCVSLIC